jgi:uncharacterized phage protein (TIGR01671 family)
MSKKETVAKAVNPMREILFRGKTLLGKWIEGDLLNYLGYGKVHIVQHYLGAGGQEVIPETVGQYTGLTDKFGKKIFEGDIVAIEHIIRTTFWIEIPETHKPRRSYDCHWNEKEDELLYKRNYAVEWKAKDARWILRSGSDQHDLRDVFMFFHKGIVIGNIHDNPELLKGGGEG